jgi:hypothetical protein
VVLHGTLALDAVGLTTIGGNTAVVVATWAPRGLGASVLAFRSGGPGLMRVEDSGESVARLRRSS